MSASMSPEEITRLGEEIYSTKLKVTLETDHMGEYVALDVVSGEYEVDRDMLTAVNKARANSPDRLLYITQVGDDVDRSAHHKEIRYAWHFQ